MTPEALTAALARLVEDFAGVAGIAAERLDGGERVELFAEQPFPTASAIKVFVLYELFARASRGELDLGARVELGPEQTTLGSGVLVHLDPGLTPTLGDLGTLMMMLSDNAATNALIARLGSDAINRTIAQLGLVHTRLGGPVDFARLAADKRALGVATPRELADFYARLGRAELLPAAWTERMLDRLRIQKYIEPLRRLLPADPYAREFGEPEPVWVASKTGSLSGVRCEAGLIASERGRWSVAVMTEGVTDTRVTSDNEAVLLIARASRMIYDAWG